MKGNIGGRPKLHGHNPKPRPGLDSSSLPLPVDPSEGASLQKDLFVKALALASAVLLLLSGCTAGEDEQDDPINDTPPQSHLDGNTAPTDRDPTPVTGTGGAIPDEAQGPVE